MAKRTFWDRVRSPDEGTGARSFYNWIAAIPKWARGYRDGLPNHLLGYEAWIFRRAVNRAVHPSLFELAAMIGVPIGAWITVGKLAGADAAFWSGVVSILSILFVFMAIEGWKAWKEVAPRGDLLRIEVRT